MNQLIRAEPVNESGDLWDKVTGHQGGQCYKQSPDNPRQQGFFEHEEIILRSVLYIRQHQEGRQFQPDLKILF